MGDQNPWAVVASKPLAPDDPWAVVSSKPYSGPQAPAQGQAPNGQGKSHGVVLDTLWNTGKALAHTAAYGGDVLDNVAVGAAKSLLTPVIGGGQLIRSTMGMPRAVDDPNAIKVPINPQATNTAQQVGKTGGEIAQFFVPAGAVTKATNALKTGKGVLGALVRAGAEGAASAGVHTLQTGSTEGAVDFGVMAGAGGLAASMATRLAAKPITWLGERIERALLKPGAAAEGFTPSELVRRVYAQGVGGTLGQTYDKTAEKITQKVAQLQNVLKSSASLGGQGVRLNQVARDTMDAFQGNPQAQKAVERIFEHVEFGMNSHGLVPPKSGAAVMSLSDANVAKQAVGDLGAWMHNMQGATVSDAGETMVLQNVANKFYDNLKNAIEANAVGPVKAINKDLSDLMAIRQAVIRRIPVAERANIISLGDKVSLSAHALGLGIVSRLLQSGRVANALVYAGKGVANNANTIGSTLGRVGAAAVPGQEGIR